MADADEQYKTFQPAQGTSKSKESKALDSLESKALDSKEEIGGGNKCSVGKSSEGSLDLGGANPSNSWRCRSPLFNTYMDA